MNTWEMELNSFEQYLTREEKSRATIKKYLRDLRCFAAYAAEQELNKELVLGWKQSLLDAGYRPRSVNSMLAAVNVWLRSVGREECRVKSLRLQRQVYSRPDQELTRQEYERLLQAASERPRLRMLLQTICATGIRVSELRYFTVGAVREGEVTVNCKSKTRTVLIPDALCRELLAYAGREGIADGAVFRTRTGRPLDRSNIWAEMKSLCASAGVEPEKVYPHNLRKLFARAFYGQDQDIAKLADVLGHSSIETTRIYIMTTGAEHRQTLERLHLLL